MRRSSSGAIAAVAALAVLALIALVVLRTPGASMPSESPSASASASASSALPSASATLSASARPTLSAQPTASASGVRPDARHGVLARGPTDAVLRTEADAKALAQLPVVFGAAVTRDGSRVAMIRSGQAAPQLVTFDAARPDQQKTVVDFSGSGELPDQVVWSADAPNDVLISVHRSSVPGQVTYSTLRVVDLATGQVREITRITSGLWLQPVVWHGANSVAAAIEVDASGFAVSYLLIRGTALTRTPLGPHVVASSVRSDARGERVLAIGGVVPRGVQWWPYDHIDQQRELHLAPNGQDDVGIALWRPGMDEVAVFVAPLIKGPQPGPRIEVWSLAGQRRIVREGSPLGIVRTDGSAVITTDWVLVDLETSLATPLSGGSLERTPYLAVLL